MGGREIRIAASAAPAGLAGPPGCGAGSPGGVHAAAPRAGARGGGGPGSPGMSPRLAAGRRPWWIWAAPFALVLIVLVVRSRFLFRDRYYEDVDAGANSILIQQAMHFTLLVG